MAKTKLSKKYQIVVPKEVREKMKLKAGEIVALYSLDDRRAVLVREPKDYVGALEGLGKEVWEALGGANEYIKKERGSWEKK
ncbi:MAG: AbrB/MazE/SpoVT family DNA-binding domain-containing protein [Candidatus Wildermuthbacteria bacterium]|nr:AbrB/MazE/SpoVT family DNA-binding domain-containing protein [Candidatus Wildermuthbacteria bacterium]